jgi:iron-sulfur cluster repair protein YtfE (RIC family)
METTPSLARLTPDITLAHLISVDPQAAEMLASIGLDPAEHKEETLRSVCKQRQWSEVEVLQWIKKHRPATNGNSGEGSPRQEPDFGNDILKWTNYIEEKLHATNVQLLNEIGDDFPRVHQIHGNQYPHLKNMKLHFEAFEEAIRLYLTFEKKKLFELIRKWNKYSGDVLHGTIHRIKKGIAIMREDQTRLQNYMNTLRDKGNGFESPAGACSTLRILNQNFKMLYSGLDKQFEVEKEALIPIIEQRMENLH